MCWTVTILKAIFFLVLSQGINSGMRTWGQRLTTVQRMPSGLGRSLEGKWQPTPVFLLGNSMDRGAGRLQAMGSQRFRYDWAQTQSVHRSLRHLTYVCVYIYRHNLYMCRANSVLLIVSNIYIRFPCIWFGQIPSGCSGFSLGFLLYLLK